MKIMRTIQLIILAVLLSACSPDSSTSPPRDPSLRTEADPEGEGFVTIVETGDRYSQTRIYFRFDDGGERFPLSPESSTDWDLSFRFAWIEINGGVNGPGGMELLYLDFADYNELSQAPAGDYLTDSEELLAFDAGQGWYHYTPGTEEWFINDRLYVLRTVDGRYYKLKIISFFDEQGLPGRLEFRWAEIETLHRTRPAAADDSSK